MLLDIRHNEKLLSNSLEVLQKETDGERERERERMRMRDSLDNEARRGI